MAKTKQKKSTKNAGLSRTAKIGIAAAVLVIFLVAFIFYRISTVKKDVATSTIDTDKVGAGAQQGGAGGTDGGGSGGTTPPTTLSTTPATTRRRLSTSVSTEAPPKSTTNATLALNTVSPGIIYDPSKIDWNKFNWRDVESNDWDKYIKAPEQTTVKPTTTEKPKTTVDPVLIELANKEGCTQM
jgi:hypothetical protein